ncbi:MAG: hypothetical protein IPJ19_13870 [Planctomycetes bacterium]|nr:hypothetical protein [Planctomycetota bacterium]
MGRAELARRLAGLKLEFEAPAWSAAEWAAHLAEELPTGLELDAPIEGVLALAPHESELALAPLARALAHLERGERVLLVVPESLPVLGEIWAAALEGVGGWSRLQDDGFGILRALVAEPRIGALEASGPPARVVELAALGAQRVRTLRNTSLVVRAADDPQQAARRAAQLAFGRVGALSGQRAGALGRVVCHECVFSRFQAALLAILEQPGDFARPVPLFERATREHLDAARTLGLDEGATLVLQRRSDGACVFTNVDERLRLATLARCAGLLTLVRATSDEQADEFARRLDTDEHAEDLA